MTHLSVVIPCFNEEAIIGGLLDALCTQTELNFEVIVVNSASTDKTVKVVNTYRDRLNLRVVEAPRGISKARNVGAAAATGDWIVFLDADVTIDSTFVTGVRQYIDTPKAKGLHGFHFYAVSRNLFDRSLFGAYWWYCLAVSYTPWPNFAGFGMLAPKALHEQIGGFNEKLSYSEDTDYALRMAKAGAPPRFLTHVRLGVSVRRLDQYGRTKMVGKYLKAEFIRFRQGGAVHQDNLDDYEFGNYSRKDK